MPLPSGGMPSPNDVGDLCEEKPGEARTTSGRSCLMRGLLDSLPCFEE